MTNYTSYMIHDQKINKIRYMWLAIIHVLTYSEYVLCIDQWQSALTPTPWVLSMRLQFSNAVFLTSFVKKESWGKYTQSTLKTLFEMHLRISGPWIKSAMIILVATVGDHRLVKAECQYITLFRQNLLSLHKIAWRTLNNKVFYSYLHGRTPFIGLLNVLERTSFFNVMLIT